MEGSPMKSNLKTELYRMLERAEADEREADRAADDAQHDKLRAEDRDREEREIRALERMAHAFEHIAERLHEISITGLRR